MTDPTNLNFLKQLLHRPVLSISVESMAEAGGGSGGEISRLHLVTSLEHDDEKEINMTLVLKKTPSDEISRAISHSLGLVRECYFYEQLPSLLQATGNNNEEEVMSLLAKVYWAVTDRGTKAILFEDVDGVQSGYLFGPDSSPRNWNKNLEELTGSLLVRRPNLGPEEVMESAFAAVATLHAAFWNETALLKKTWLRGTAWMIGEDKDQWLASQRRCTQLWALVKERMGSAVEESSAVDQVRWDPLLVSCIDASCAKAEDWTLFQAEIHKRPFTLVHGDFHPANILVRLVGEKSKVESILIDFELVGVASGPRDLGKYMVFHLPSHLREEIEEAMVRVYYEALCAKNPHVAKTMSWDECWSEYVQGAVASCIWLLVVFENMFRKDRAPVQFYHDQLAAFLRSHHITPANVPMPSSVWDSP